MLEAVDVHNTDGSAFRYSNLTVPPVVRPPLTRTHRRLRRALRVPTPRRLCLVEPPTLPASPQVLPTPRP